MDGSGNLYGTTSQGGTSSDCGGGCGTVFELVNSAGSYTEKVLYNFTGPDGDGPSGPLIMDASGNLYGTTVVGGNTYLTNTSGTSSNCSIYGPPGTCGTVFELVKSAGGYTEKVLYSFTGTPDGSYPGGLAMDASGNLYGTTSHGGTSSNCTDGCGTVFELVNSAGSYSEKVLYSFTGAGGDGAGPNVDLVNAGLVMDASGNLYGTTEGGGTASNCAAINPPFTFNGCGTVFELVNSAGSYSEKVLYSFTGAGGDGAGPNAGLVMDASGNLYGTTFYGGGNSSTTCPTEGCGTVFELVSSAGSYTEKVLYSFTGSTDGSNPISGLVMDAAGDLYGTADAGGASQGGTVFELVNSAGSYGEKLLYGFAGAPDAGTPNSSLVMDASGNLYGTTFYGGDTYSFTTGSGVCVFGCGAAYKVSLNPSGLAFTLSPTSLVFSNQEVGTTSAAQRVTVTNTGNANLTFAVGAVALSGANKADFAISADSCGGATVAAASTCSVGVMFTPSVAGNESSALSFADNAANSPQTVTLSGMGADFSVGVATGGSSSATVSPGGTASYTLSVAPLGGFNQAVSLACSDTPSKATCSVSPSSVTLNGSTASTVTVTVTTTAPSLAPPAGPGTRSPGTREHWPLVYVLILLLALAGLTKSLRDAELFGRRLRRALLVALLLGTAALGACGGGGGGPSGPTNHGTPAGTYTLTVTGTSGNLSHSQSLTLSVQ